MMCKSGFIVALAVPLLVFAGCAKEQDTAEVREPLMTIRVSLPEEPLTKAGFSVPGSGTGLHVAWQEGDCILVIGDGGDSAVYTIDAGFTDHWATFSGPAVAGSTFEILTPGTYESVEEAEAGNPTLTQTGNGSTDHLVFTAKLGNVDKADLPEITFSDSWVGEHPGTELYRGGIVKFVLTLPAEAAAPTKVQMTGLGNDISLNLEDVVLGTDHVLTAYAQSGWEDEPIGGNPFTVTVSDTDGNVWTVDKTVSGGKVLKAGAQNSLEIRNGFTRKLFAGGDGTAGNPYLIANAWQLNNMHADGVLKHGEKVYFRLTADIDMQEFLSGTPWIPVNYASPYDFQIDFDGGNHTIDHFSVTYSPEDKDTFKNPGFFGLLYGECHDVSFTNATIVNTYGLPTGILAGYCGYDGKVARVWNVHVQGTLSYTSSLSGADGNGPVGGLAGRVHTAFIDSCSADCEITSNKNYAGGLFGIDWGSASTIRNCWTSGSLTGGQRLGGICGGLIKNETAIYNCFSTMEIHGAFALGGIAGHCNQDKGDGVTTRLPDNVIKDCIAWNESIRCNTQTPGDMSHYSSGAIVGFTATHNYLSGCLRRSDLDFYEYSDLFGLYDQEDASPSVPLVTQTVSGANYNYPYHGKAFTGTLSAAARSLGWDETVWDLSGSMPVLTGAVEAQSGSDVPQSGAGLVPPGDDSLRGLGEVRPSAGNGWTITNVADGIVYYRYAANCPETENKYQDVFIVDLDLSKTQYAVKVVYSNPSTVCSDIFANTDAYAAINGGYERASIALKANWFWDGSSLTNFPQGVFYSTMPNNYITDGDEQIPNWKSEGTFYTDGFRNLKIAFDGYDPDTPTKTKTVQQERLFYQLCCDDWPGLISSAPVLIHDFNPVGKNFKNLHPKTYSSSEDPNTHQRGQYPRTAVALTEGNHFLMVVCDGRYATGYGGNGMSAQWLTTFLAKYFNPQYAINLDGGGSSTMCVRNSAFAADNYVVNYPCDNRGNSSKIHDHEGERNRDSWIVIVDAQ